MIGKVKTSSFLGNNLLLFLSKGALTDLHLCISTNAMYCLQYRYNTINKGVWFMTTFTFHRHRINVIHETMKNTQYQIMEHRL